MKCCEVVEFLSDYLAGQLAPTLRTDFERHIADCRDCATYLDSFRQTIQLSKSAHADTATAPPPAELVQAVRAAISRARNAAS